MNPTIAAYDLRGPSGRMLASIFHRMAKGALHVDVRTDDGRTFRGELRGIQTHPPIHLRDTGYVHPAFHSIDVDGTLIDVRTVRTVRTTKSSICGICDDRTDKPRCVYCGAVAVATDLSDFYVCNGHADMRTDKYL